jgi:hypothetical protein
MKKTLVATLVFSFLNLGFALAQPRPSQTSPAQSNYQKTTKFDFENDVVEGSVQRPDGDAVDGTKKMRQTSLLKIRQHFHPEMLKSVESL